MPFLSISLTMALALAQAQSVDLPSAPASRASRARVLSGGMTDADYPDAAREREEEGRVYVSYLVTLDGRASECRVERSSGSPTLDAKTCEIVNTRYLMEPPRDDAGNPISKRVRQFIVWQLAL